MSDNELSALKALFIGSGCEIYPDHLICSGIVPAELNGTPCEYSVNNKIPKLRTLSVSQTDYSIDKGKEGDLCPPCALQQLSSLGNWVSEPKELLGLRLFKCRKGFWLVIPGLYDSEPQKLK